LKSPSYTGWLNITTDASGNIYVSGSDAIRKISPSGNVSVLPNTKSGVMTTDAGGNLYSLEASSNVIRKITPEGIANTIIVDVNIGAGAKGIAADRAGNLYVLQYGVSKITQAGTGSGVAAQPADFYPVGMTIDREDNLYVAYTKGTETIIQKITPQGTVSTVFSSSTGDGVAADGNHLYAPKGIAMAGAKTIALTVDNGVFLLQLP
jgi:DNA-binding beta-propeller fold protein YncE